MIMVAWCSVRLREGYRARKKPTVRSALTVATRFPGGPERGYDSFAWNCGPVFLLSQVYSSSTEVRVDPEPESLKLARTRLGRRSQVGGGIAAFIGLLLLLATPPTPPAAVNVHQMAMIFIAVGVFGILAGTLARWYYFD